jgi:hypothetical protein
VQTASEELIDNSSGPHGVLRQLRARVSAQKKVRIATGLLFSF